ncbi:hypothetical protein [Nocardioides glacieisoli]|uniref:hypothetical protein n=1 Tax=Nocardioides glacieisoli TaxID=1168730 RepID=UPI0013EBC75C|nr:hypothetical protein [Nocardioides glacieisoli]
MAPSADRSMATACCTGRSKRWKVVSDRSIVTTPDGSANATITPSGEIAIDSSL